jgi:signal transduction histidine kinase/ligand-binding sensor domain-containing protein
MLFPRWFNSGCFLLLLYLVSALAPEARAQYRFDHWTTDNGLPQNTVTGVVQTRDGYLWLTTFDGLARFDGVRFTVFDKSNSKGINSNRFTCLYEAGDGALLIGTEDAGLTVYRNGIFTSYTTADGLPGNQVYRISPDLKGDPVIFTSKGSVYLRDDRIVPAPPQPQRERKLYLASSGTQVTIEASGVTRVKDGRATHYAIKSAANDLPVVATPYEDRRGNLWIRAWSNLYLLRDGQTTLFPKIPTLDVVCDDADGGLWFSRPTGAGAGGDIVARFKDGSFTVFGDADGVLNSTVYSIISDREGSIRLATSRGLYRARKRFLTAYSTESGLATHEIYPLVQSPDGAVWVGSSQGLNQVSLRDGRFESSPTVLAGKGIQALCEDDAGRLWIGAFGGLLRYENGKIQDLSALFNYATVFDIKSDREGKHWVASDQGLFKLDGDKLVAHYTTKDGLPGDDVKIIHQDRGGKLWFGTYGGLAQLKDGRFIAYTAPHLANDGLTVKRVRSIYEDAEGTFWIGTYDEGLSRFRDGKFFNYRTEHGLFNNGVFQILEDRRGYFWISCNKGIYRVSRRELDEMAEGRIPRINSVAFGKDDGMFNTECNGGRQPAGFIAQDGKLWFPTMGGVVVIDPDAAQANPQLPPVIIETIKLDRGQVDFRNGVTVAPGQRDLEINYTGLSLVKSDQARFKYKLEGLDADWVDAGTRRVVNFTYLPPGGYRFRVIAANSDGVWNNEGAALDIFVATPFYRAWWFIALVTLSLAGIAAFVYRRRFTALRTRQAAQEAFSRQLIESQEGERKRIAAELHDSLGQRLLVIKNWAALSLMISPEDAPAREHLNEISENASQALEETRQIVSDLRPYQLDKIGLTRTLEFTVEQIADSSGINITARIAELDGAFGPEGEISFYRMVQECLNNIVKHSGASEARVLIERDAVIRLQVADNGLGFAVNMLDQKKRGFGLSGLAERARMLGGDYTIQSEPGGGTTVSVTIGIRQ